MKLVDATKDTLVVEFTSKDVLQIGSLFSVIAGSEKPNWWVTEDGTDEPVLNEKKFKDLWDAWDSVITDEKVNVYPVKE